MAETNGDQAEFAAAGGESAAEVLDSFKIAADSLIEEQKARVADSVRGLAQALRRSADAFAEEGGAPIARAAAQLAGQIEEFSDTMRSRPWRLVLADVEDGVRARPELYFAGALAAGFLVGRLMAGAASRTAAEG